MTTRPSTAAPILVAIVLLLGAYVGGYYWLGEHLPTTGGDFESIRVYDARWQCVVFTPAAWIEGVIHGREVSLGYAESD